MKRHLGVYLVGLFASTLLSTYSLKVIQGAMLCGYLRCFSGGIILSLITLRILPQIYTQHTTFISPFMSGVVFLTLFSLEQILSEDTYLVSSKRQFNAVLFCSTIGIQSLREGLSVFRATECMHGWFIYNIIGHKWLEGLALGCVVFDSVFSSPIEHLCIHIYALLAPLGVVLGAIFKKRDFLCLRGFTEHLCTGVLMGCLFYVGFIEKVVGVFYRNSEALRPGIVVCIAASGFTVASLVSYAIERLCEGCEKTDEENAQLHQLALR
eukprot:jgi/Antlo1/939/2455